MSLPRDAATVTDAFLAEADERFPGRLQALYLHGSLGWGELFDGSDLDFVAVWDRVPGDLEALAAAHDAVRGRHPERAFGGFHCVAADLAADTTRVGARPAYYQGRFDRAGTIDISPVTWHELADRPVVVRGDAPAVRTDVQQLLAYTHSNLDTYWRGLTSPTGSVGAEDSSVVWLGLGPARLHHLLARGTLTSKSGAGRYVRDDLDDRWNLIARESLRLREQPGTPSLYDDLDARGRDAHDLLVWLVEDGCRLGRDRGRLQK